MTYSVLKVPLNPNQPTNRLQKLPSREKWWLFYHSVLLIWQSKKV